MQMLKCQINKRPSTGFLMSLKPPTKKAATRKLTRTKQSKALKTPSLVDEEDIVEDITPTSVCELKEWIVSQNVIMRKQIVSDICVRSAEFTRKTTEDHTNVP